jgi:hypothetical protein
MYVGDELLSDEPEAYWLRLRSEPLPQAEWTRNDINWALAYWTPRAGRAAWRPLIRVNKSLKATKAVVSDAMLEYLLWHELCHHILPGNGHDSEFRRLEHKWPEAATRDFELDDICRHYQVGTTAH